VSLIVPVEFSPPTTDAGTNVRLESMPAGLTVSTADFEVEFRLADSVSVSVDATTDVATVKLAVVAPDATVTEEG